MSFVAVIKDLGRLHSVFIKKKHFNSLLGNVIGLMVYLKFSSKCLLDWCVKWRHVADAHFLSQKYTYLLLIHLTT